MKPKKQTRDLIIYLTDLISGIKKLLLKYTESLTQKKIVVHPRRQHLFLPVINWIKMQDFLNHTINIGDIIVFVRFRKYDDPRLVFAKVLENPLESEYVKMGEMDDILIESLKTHSDEFTGYIKKYQVISLNSLCGYG